MGNSQDFLLINFWEYYNILFKKPAQFANVQKLPADN